MGKFARHLKLDGKGARRGYVPYLEQNPANARPRQQLIFDALMEFAAA
jgi:hypothetical protein